MTNKSPLLVCAIGIALSGCSSMRIVAPHADVPHEDTLNYAEVQGRIRETPVSIFLTDGRVHKGTVAYVGADSLRWVNNDNDSTYVVSVQSVLRLEKKNHFSGALVGLLAGGAGGGLLGWAYGSHVSRGDMRDLGVALHLFSGAAMGAFGGLLFGGGFGLTSVYRFQEDGAEPAVSPPAKEELRSE